MGIMHKAKTSNNMDNKDVKHYLLDDYLSRINVNDSIYSGKVASLLSYIGGILPSDEDFNDEGALYHYNCKTFLVSEDDKHYIIKNNEDQSVAFKLHKVRVNDKYPDLEMICYMLNSISKFYYASFSGNKLKLRSQISFFNDKDYIFDTSDYYKYPSNFFLFLPENYQEDERYQSLKSYLYDIKNILYSKEFLNAEIAVGLDKLKRLMKFGKDGDRKRRVGILFSFLTKSDSNKTKIENIKNMIAEKRLKSVVIDESYNEVSSKINSLFFDLINQSNLFNIDFLTKLYLAIYTSYYNPKDFTDQIVNFIMTKNLTNIFAGYAKRLFHLQIDFNKNISVQNILDSVDTYITMTTFIIENMFKTLRYYFINRSYEDIRSLFLTYYPVLTLSTNKKTKKYDLYNEFYEYMNGFLNQSFDSNIKLESGIYIMMQNKDYLNILRSYMLKNRLEQYDIRESFVKNLDLPQHINKEFVETFIQVKKTFINLYNLVEYVQKNR
ncbi:MAG: hypothetical protein QXS19_07000 [Candidatus Methanomethylicia archaeon]